MVRGTNLQAPSRKMIRYWVLYNLQKEENSRDTGLKHTPS